MRTAAESFTDNCTLGGESAASLVCKIILELRYLTKCQGTGRIGSLFVRWFVCKSKVGYIEVLSFTVTKFIWADEYRSLTEEFVI